jgi:hypothetical protein
MPKTWQPHQAKQFARQLQLNKPYYVVFNMATNLAPYEDGQTYSEYTFTSRLPLTGTPLSGRMGIDAVTLCQNFGPVYDAPPRGLRNIADPPPQVAGPLGHGEYSGYLDEAEINGLGKRVRSGSDPATRQPVRARGRR